MSVKKVARFVAFMGVFAGVVNSAWADHARFRGGVAAEGGAVIAPGSFTVGVAGIQGQLGAQINDLIGVYAVPSFDIVFGPVAGINLAGAVLVDFTLLNSLLTVGVGPDVGVIAAIGVATTATGASASAIGGVGYGGRIHLAVNPYVARGPDGVRRKALVIGVDLRMLVGGAASATATGAGSTGSYTQFLLSPMLTIGYQAF